MKKIVVSYFEPFLQDKVNSSELVALNLQELISDKDKVKRQILNYIKKDHKLFKINKKLDQQIKNIYKILEQINFIKLPVVYRKSFNHLNKKINWNETTDILMLGQASGREKISAERFAINWMDSEHPDGLGVVNIEKKIDNKNLLAMMTSYPLRKLKKNIPRIEISNSAGAYVCNELSYQVATKCLSLKSKSKSSKSKSKSKSKSPNWLFIHLPNTESHKSNKYPVMNLADQEKVIMDLILWIILYPGSYNTKL